MQEGLGAQGRHVEVHEEVRDGGGWELLLLIPSPTAWEAWSKH